MANSSFINAAGLYFETMEPVEALEGATAVPQRPGEHFDWDGTAWIARALSPDELSRIEAAALARIDWIHADLLRRVTGDATPEERDTWKAKEEAARAMIAETATAGQAAMIEAEAPARGMTVPELAALIVAKSDAYLAAIGQAAALRAQGRAAIGATIAGEPPAEWLPAALDAVVETISATADAAIAAVASG